jgi:membrane protease YdiL (CAAX protease family)
MSPQRAFPPDHPGLHGVAIYQDRDQGDGTGCDEMNVARHLAGLGEEIVVVGYLFTRLKQIGWSPWTIVIVAAVLRGSYHLYQGFGGFLGNIAMGIVFGAIYLRTKRLLPLITAHVAIDTVAFVGYPTAVALFPDVFA